MLFAITGGKGSPGATTLAVAMAARWPSHRSVVVVEADPAGGDLAARCGLPDTPGLASWVVAGRHATPTLLGHSQRLAVGVDVVPAPALGAAAAVAALDPDLLRPADVDVVVDLGRLSLDQIPGRILAAADTAILVVRGDLASLDHAAAHARHLADRFAVVAVVGATPYHPVELGELFGKAAISPVPIDHRAAAALTGAHRPPRGWHRVGLPAAAHTLALSVAGAAHPPRPATEAAVR